MNKKSVKIFWVLLIITILVFVIQFIISSNTVYIGNNTRVLSIGSKIIKYNRNNSIILRKVNVYKGNRISKGYLKSTKADNENEYYLTSINNRNINVKTIVASGSMLKLSVIDPIDELNTITESKIHELNSILDVDLKTENIVKYKRIKYDIDNDSDDEEVLYISYVLNNISSDRIIIKDNSIVKVVEYDFDYKDLQDKPQKAYGLVNIIDFNKDDIYEIVVSRVDGDSQPTYYDIYSYENGSIKKIK